MNIYIINIEDEVSPPDKFLRLLIEKNQNPELSGITGNLQHIMEGAQIDVLSTKIGKRFKMIQEQTGKLNDHMLEVKQKLSKKAANRASYYDNIERKSKIKADKILSGKYAKILNRPQTGATVASMSRKDVRGDSASGTGRTHPDYKASFGETDRTNDPSKSMSSPYAGRFGSNTDATQASEQDEDYGGGARIQDLMFSYRNSFNNQGGVDMNPVGIHKLKIPQTNSSIKKPSESKKTRSNYGAGDTSRSSFGVKTENKFKIRALPHSSNSIMAISYLHSNSMGLRIGTAKVGSSSKDLASTKVPASPTAGGLADDPIMDASSASLDSLTEIKLDRLYSEAIVLKEKKHVLDRLEHHRGSRELINDLVQKRLAEVNARVQRTNCDRLTPHALVGGCGEYAHTSADRRAGDRIRRLCVCGVVRRPSAGVRAVRPKSTRLTFGLVLFINRPFRKGMKSPYYGFECVLVVGSRLRVLAIDTFVHFEFKYLW